jgi:protein TonB
MYTNNDDFYESDITDLTPDKGHSHRKSMLLLALFIILIAGIYIYQHISPEGDLQTDIPAGKVTVQEMCADFNQHAMKARKKYYGNWFEITGALGETDMDGKYFYLESADKAIKCIIPKSTREKVVDKLTQAERGDIITVKGKVIDIGQSEYYEVTTADVYPNSSATTAASEEYDIASKEVSSRTVEHSGNAASEEADSKTASTTQDNGHDIHEEEQKASDMTPEESSSTPAEDTKVFSYVDQMPIFPGGESALMNYIASNLKYPSAAQDQGIQGLVMLRFVVTGTGKVGEVQVLKSLDPSCDREAIRVVKSLPRFTPGRQQGKPVNVWFQLPVRFELR